MEKKNSNYQYESHERSSSIAVLVPDNHVGCIADVMKNKNATANHIDTFQLNSSTSLRCAVPRNANTAAMTNPVMVGKNAKHANTTNITIPNKTASNLLSEFVMIID